MSEIKFRKEIQVLLEYLRYAKELTPSELDLYVEELSKKMLAEKSLLEKGLLAETLHWFLRQHL